MNTNVSPSIMLAWVFLCIPMLSPGQNLPSERIVNWQLAGRYEFPQDTNQVLNILDFGGYSDGASPNDSAILQAQAAMGDDGGVIYFPPGEYLFSSPIFLQSDMVLKGSSSSETTLLFDVELKENPIHAEGYWQAESIAITGGANRGSHILNLASDTLFSTGDFVLLVEEDEDLVHSAWAKNTTGQVNRIASITGTQVELRSPLRRNYRPTKNPRLHKIYMVERAGVQDLKVVHLNATQKKNSNLLFHYTANCFIKCIESEKCNYGHVEVARSTNMEISGSYFHDAYNFGGGGKAYGVTLHYATGECKVENNIFRKLRHSMLLQAGANGNVLAYNFSTEPFWISPGLPNNAAGDLVLHGNYPYANLFEGNSVYNMVIDDSHGKQGPYNTLFRNRAQGYGFLMGSNPPPDSQNIIGNEVISSFSIFIVNGIDHFLQANYFNDMLFPDTNATLAQTSFFADEPPAFFYSNTPWPPIGFPNDPDGYTNTAEERYYANMFIQCEAIPPTVSTKANPLPLQAGITLSPNPASHSVQLDLENELDLKDIEFINCWNAQGQSIFHKRPDNLRIDVQHWPSGFYVVELILHSGQRITEKLLVQH